MPSVALLDFNTTPPQLVVSVHELGQEPVPEAELPEHQIYSHEEKWQIIPEEGFLFPEPGMMFFVLENDPHGVVGFQRLDPPQEGAASAGLE